MKTQLLYIIASAIILTTSTGFGFIESSNIGQGRVHTKVQADSLQFNGKSFLTNDDLNPTTNKKKSEKPVNTNLAKSIMQWIGTALKDVIESIALFLFSIVEAILVEFIKLVTK